MPARRRRQPPFGRDVFTLMSDLGFIMIIGWLVSYTIVRDDTGVAVTLRPYAYDTIVRVPVPVTDVLHVAIERRGVWLDGELFVGTTAALTSELTGWMDARAARRTGAHSYLRLSPARNAPYTAYLTTLDAVAAALRRRADQLAYPRYGRLFADLPAEKQRLVFYHSLAVRVVEDQPLIERGEDRRMPLDLTMTLLNLLD